MTNAVILSAGQGRRLLPLTENQPKCMLEIADRTILQWQIDALLANNIESIHVITGFHAEQINDMIAEKYAGVKGIRTIFNPFFSVSDNLASCWMASAAMEKEFVLINGDTIFEPAILKHVLGSPDAPITLTIDKKSRYDEDDMKVELNGSEVVHVSKVLNESQTHAESIGMLYFRDKGAELFRNRVSQSMHKPSGLKSWFLSVIDELAGEGKVQARSIAGFRWAEIDFIADLKNAEKLLS